MLLEGNEEKRIHVDSLVAKLVLNLVAKLLNFTTDQGSNLHTKKRLATPTWRVNYTAHRRYCYHCAGSSEIGELNDKERVLVVMLRLSDYAYIGHRMLLAASKEMSMVLERLQCMDPFDEGFSQIYENLFFV